jgi:predicted DNA-binding protein (UPF0251 family)
MKQSNPQNSTIIDQSVAISVTGRALAESLQERTNDRQPYPQSSSNQRSSLGTQITTEQVTKYLHEVAAESIEEIDTLMRDLRGLQENLAAHRLRVEQGTVQFLELNRSILKLTDVITDRVGQVKTDR